MARNHGLLQQERLITERQEALLEELRALLERLVDLLEHFGADVDPSDERTVKDTLAHLEELFLIVVAGEFNSGKSSFLNALLGAAILPEGVTPTTDEITLLQHGETTGSLVNEAGLRIYSHPAEVLRQLTVVDTPGTNAVIRRHEELSRNFVPRADMVLFITSVDRPFTESERGFLELIKEWGKKIVIVINKIDLLEAHELEQVVSFVAEHGRDLLGTSPEIFPVSARRAVRSRDAGEEGGQLWEESRFGDIEHYVLETLDEETRVRLKLLSPLGVGRRLSDKYRQATAVRLEMLREDLLTIENIDQQLDMFRSDLQNDVKYYLGEIDTILRELQDRGDQFFDETLKINRIGDLLKSKQLREEFEREVVGDVNTQIEQRVNTLIDWMIEKNLRLQQSTDDYIRRRATQHSEQMIGNVGGSFDYNRRALIESVGRAAQSVVASYDKEVESQNLADEVRASIAATAITEAGAVGLGAILVALFHTALLDVTGILAAAVVAIGGFALLPAKRRQAKRQFRAKVDELRDQLRESVERQFEREVDQSIGQIRERNEPFTRFVRAQRTRLSELRDSFVDLEGGLDRLRNEIER
jgi:small GTP-binding protein